MATAKRTSTECILGIDPGTAATGFAIIQRVGVKLEPVWYDCMRTSPKESVSDRLVKIHTGCQQIIQRFQPDVAAIEELFFGAGAKAALAVGQARGVTILACATAGVPVFEYSPMSIKQAVSGYGRADKQQVQRMVQTILGMTEIPRPDHAADALGVAICHAGSLTIR